MVLVSLACQAPAIPALQSLPWWPQVQPTPAPASTAPASGSLLFEDDFSDRNTGWDRQGVTEGLMDYDAGGYRILVNSTQANFWSTPNKDLADVRVEVDEGKLGGPDENRVGLICRYTGNSYYFFMITHDGFYGIGIFSGDQAGGGQMTLIGQAEMQSSQYINRGTNVNHLRADCVGDTLALYVNGEQLARVQDSRLTHGDVGLLVGTFAQPGADVIFDNFVAIQP
jgi:hypothetical protein